MTFSKRILNFAIDYFGILKKWASMFLQGDLKESLKERLSKIPLSFHWLMFTFKTFFMISYNSEYFVTASIAWEAGGTLESVTFVVDFFVDDLDIASKIDREFLLTKNGIQHLLICELTLFVKHLS